MDLKRLRYFIAVADAGGFSRAAEQLHMSQPPLSRRIQELEAELGAQLIDREARPQRLTEAGRMLLELARPILWRFDQLQAAMRSQLARDRPRLRVAAPPSAIPDRLPEVIRAFRRESPDADLALVELTSPEQIQALKEGVIDVGIGRVRIEDPAIHRTVLIEEPLLAAVPADHVLALSGEPVSLADLSTEPLVIFPNDARPSFGDYVLSRLHDHGLAPAILKEVRDLHTALMLVAAGEGVCIAPQAASAFHHPHVAVRPLRENVTAPLIQCTRSGDPSPVLKVFCELARQTFQANSASGEGGPEGPT